MRRSSPQVNAIGKPRIVLAGLWTCVCIVGPALSALDQGFEVYVIADACGDVSDEAHERAMDRMIQAGARPMTALQYLLELQRDWARSETYDLTTGIAQAASAAPTALASSTPRRCSAPRKAIEERRDVGRSAASTISPRRHGARRSNGGGRDGSPSPACRARPEHRATPTAEGPATMPTVTTSDGVEIFYKDWGPKDAQPIVFHHGWPLSSDDWDAQMLFFLQQGLPRRRP